MKHEVGQAAKGDPWEVQWEVRETDSDTDGPQGLNSIKTAVTSLYLLASALVPFLGRCPLGEVGWLVKSCCWKFVRVVLNNKAAPGPSQG